MSGYFLSVRTWGGSGVQFRQEETYKSAVVGDVPSVGDLLTIHPDGKPSASSFTCTVTGVQRLILANDNPEAWPTQSSVHVTGKIQA